MTELEAARFLLAGLDLLGEAVPHLKTRAGGLVMSARESAQALVFDLEKTAPPWTPEPGPDAPVAWSLVACGDEVQAPNGQWYRVTGMARVGQQVTAMLNEAIRSSVKATDKVPTRRGPVGQAMDVLLAGGLELELIGASE